MAFIKAMIYIAQKFKKWLVDKRFNNLIVN